MAGIYRQWWAMTRGRDENGSETDGYTDNFSFSERILGSNTDTDSIFFVE
jgi:hypothetical protein